MNIAEENINKAGEIYDRLVDLQAELVNTRRGYKEAIALLKRCDRHMVVGPELHEEIKAFLEKVK